MKPATGSTMAATNRKLPVRMPRGTARTDASAKPDRITSRLAPMCRNREASRTRSQPAAAISCGAARKSGAAMPP